MRSWVPDVAAQGGRGGEVQGGERKHASWRNCHCSRKKSHFWQSERVFTSSGTVAQDGMGGLGKVKGCWAHPYVVSGPLPWVLMGVWFHVSLGNDYLMEKLGALKMRKENENINGGRLVPITTETQLVWVAAASVATYSWVNNYYVTLWSGSHYTRTPMHTTQACYTLGCW